ncbi:MAG: energy transducer TonB [Xanthomonadales bacterium]|nr:energy transducer TonB [Xanthomonadales bacterium]
MSIRTLVSEPIRWPRVGAMSAALNLHVVAAGLLVLAATVPPSANPIPATPPTLQVEIVEPPPIEAPVVPALEAVLEPPPMHTPQLRRDRASPAASQVVAPRLPVAHTDLPPAPIPLSGAEPGAAVTAAPADRGVTVVRTRQPHYSVVARNRGMQGEAVLRVLVGDDGQVRTIEVLSSSGHRELDQAALLAVRAWRFSAAIEQGRPVAAWVQVPVSFRLH